ncbi:MAG: hypothetical protein H6891_09785 [Brucellaceae bacterium]|nr:hypothetical protein [Brucellaceae bacterium]
MNTASRVLLFVVGVILLLPGLCSLFVMTQMGSLGGPGSDAILLWLLWLVTFAIGWGGYVLLRKAMRG